MDTRTARKRRAFDSGAAPGNSGLSGKQWAARIGRPVTDHLKFLPVAAQVGVRKMDTQVLVRPLSGYPTGVDLPGFITGASC